MDRCYQLAYLETEIPQPEFAEFVALAPGVDSGEVRSGASPRDHLGLWDTFLVGGTWRRDRSDLVLQFTNGVADVIYRFRLTTTDSLIGHMKFRSDAAGPNPPMAFVIARPIQCTDARLGPSAKVAA